MLAFLCTSRTTDNLTSSSDRHHRCHPPWHSSTLAVAAAALSLSSSSSSILCCRRRRRRRVRLCRRRRRRMTELWSRNTHSHMFSSIGLALACDDWALTSRHELSQVRKRQAGEREFLQSTRAERSRNTQLVAEADARLAIKELALSQHRPLSADASAGGERQAAHAAWQQADGQGGPQKGTGNREGSL